MRRVWLLSPVILLAACERPALGVRYPNQTGGNRGVYDAGDSACAATCSTAPGTIALYPSDAELWAGIVGVWKICSRAHPLFIDAPADTIGAEFAPPSDVGFSDPVGNLFFLTNGPTGPVRGAGFEYQQMYQISDGVLYCHDSYNSGYDFGLKYSPCPRVWELARWGNSDNASMLAAF
jgi:hypothetical protein